MPLIDAPEQEAPPAAVRTSGPQAPQSQAPQSRNILLIELDLFRAIGGGQSVYGAIIKHRPHDRFYYFKSRNYDDSHRPANAVPILLLQDIHRDLRGLEVKNHHLFFVFQDSCNFAYSVANAFPGIAFDVVDVPDYRQNGLFIRYALEAHGIAVGTVALALHGMLSSALRVGWPWSDNPRRIFAELAVRERLHFRVAEARYGLSERYARQLSARSGGFSVNICDPLLIVEQRAPIVASPAVPGAPPDIAFVGRRERIKGPDLFLDLVWWLPREAYGRAVLIGPDGANHQGRGGDAILTHMARDRAIVLDIRPPLRPDELGALFRQRTVVVAPSRHDTFNLVALDALLHGCPTVISRSAGVAGFVARRLPQLRPLVAEMGCDRAAAMVLRDILGNYDAYRELVVDSVGRAGLQPDLDSIGRIYERTDIGDRAARAMLHDLARRFAMFHLREPGPGAAKLHGGVRRYPGLRRAVGSGRAAASKAARAYRRARRVVQHPLQSAAPIVGRRVLAAYFPGGTLAAFRQAGAVGAFYAEHLGAAERREADRRRKLKRLGGEVYRHRIDRARLFSELMRLERLNGDDLTAATYGLRIMRWLGEDRFNLLGFVRETLCQHGYESEARVADIMFGNPRQAAARTQDFLDERFDRCRTRKPEPFEAVDDRRGGGRRRVSVIVSLYRAASKLPSFVRMLRQQTLLAADELELVLIDSGSPDGEYEAFRALWDERPFPAVYARSAERETIQHAWNRGIDLSTGTYLSFLGVDEGIHPECLSLLSQQLDARPDLDWLIANSLVTEVARNGVLDKDVMLYDRTGYRQDWQYLDTTFLSWVGGLYRRDIHERFGYYDESFRAAGDTEFKNRVLPFIKSAFVPRTLGVFNNYPEERTTQHPRAEIEDLRAWYLHRTPAGMRHAFRLRGSDEIVALLRDALRYRKCFCRHWSTDLDLAQSLARVLAERDEGPRGTALPAAIETVLAAYRGLDYLAEPRQPASARLEVFRTLRHILRQRQRHQRLFDLDSPPPYEIFNDNRHEQHWWSWSQ